MYIEYDNKNTAIDDMHDLKSLLFRSHGVLVQRMFVPDDRSIALGIYCRYCILRRRILTELVFGGNDAHQTGGTPNPTSQGLAGLR